MRTSGESSGKFLKSRQPGSVRAKWTKAHATEEHVRKGSTTREEAQHNERADHAAEEGRMLHRGACRGLMNHYRRMSRLRTSSLLQGSEPTC